MRGFKMGKEEIIEDTIAFIRNEIINDTKLEIALDSNLIFSGLIDSLGIVMLITHLQKLYSIEEINYQDMVLDNFLNLNSIADMILKYC